MARALHPRANVTRYLAKSQSTDAKNFASASENLVPDRASNSDRAVRRPFYDQRSESIGHSLAPRGRKQRFLVSDLRS